MLVVVVNRYVYDDKCFGAGNGRVCIRIHRTVQENIHESYIQLCRHQCSMPLTSLNIEKISHMSSQSFYNIFEWISPGILEFLCEKIIQILEEHARVILKPKRLYSRHLWVLAARWRLRVVFCLLNNSFVWELREEFLTPFWRK